MKKRQDLPDNDRQDKYGKDMRQSLVRIEKELHPPKNHFWKNTYLEQSPKQIPLLMPNLRTSKRNSDQYKKGILLRTLCKNIQQRMHTPHKSKRRNKKS